MERSKKEMVIRVKMIARGQPSHHWRAQTPGNSGRWGNCQFLFDLEERNYDWLVVIDDVSRKLSAGPEILGCSDENTIFVTTEPPTITHYGKAFAAQFQWVLTSQSIEALPHPGRIHSTTGNLWFHGKSYDELSCGEEPSKTETLSTVCSSKQQKHTVHHARYEFTQWLKKQCPELEIYGHGVRFVERKHDALDAYRYHLAVENHIAPHHWTEKFSDSLLSYCVPIYHGCPNISDYFPKESYIAIDISKREEALETIMTELSDPRAYAKRRDAMLEARQLILERYNMLALLDSHISIHHSVGNPPSGRSVYGRKQMRLRHPSDVKSHLLWKFSKLIQNRFSR